MDRNYWEKIAPDYNDEIFDVLQQDKKSIIRAAISRWAVSSGKVIDIGCAIGKWLPVLSPLFTKVVAVDISQKNLSIAKGIYKGLPNIDYRRVDMSAAPTGFSGFDMAICINAILTDSMKKRTRFFQNIARCLKKGGRLVLVVPSMESWLITRVIQSRYQIDKDLFANKLPAKEGLKRYQNIQEGNVEIDNVLTKHYLGEELKLLLSREGLIAEEPQKIEYDWKTEFIKPPSWLKDPRPWDWMITAKKI